MPPQKFKKVFKPKQRIKENVNEGIRPSPVRVVFPDGTTEILATSVGIQKAKALGLDLILVSPSAVPPVCKVLDEGKFAYEEKKRKNQAKAHQHITKVKELKFSPNTDEHDYNFKLNHAIEFLKEKHKVKAICRFKGREVAHSNLGINLLNRLVADLANYGTAEGAPRQDGKTAYVLITWK